MWDGAQCVDSECDKRETPSYSLTGQHIITSGLLVSLGVQCLVCRWPHLCVRGWLGQGPWGGVSAAQHQGLVWPGTDITGHHQYTDLDWPYRQYCRRLQAVTVSHMHNARLFWRYHHLVIRMSWAACLSLYISRTWLTCLICGLTRAERRSTASESRDWPLRSPIMIMIMMIMKMTIELYLCRFVTHGSRRFVAVRTWP